MYTIYEGYFKGQDEDTKHLPLARARTTKWLGRREFLEALSKVEASKKVSSKTFKGSSKCRCCGEKNGNKEYTMKIGQIEVKWPEGLKHYVEEHNVRPGLMFQQLILQVAETIK